MILPAAAAGGGLQDIEPMVPGGGAGIPEFPRAEPDKPGLVQTLTHDDFGGVTSIVVAPGGRHAYAAAFHKGLVSQLARIPATGRLVHEKSLTGAHYAGAVAFRLSKDGKLGAVSAFRSNALVLFRCDPVTGGLAETDHFGGVDKPLPGLGFCVDNVFSPDGKFVYAVGSSAIVAFGIADGKLQHVETVTAPKFEGLPAENIMSGARGVAISPDGKCLYSTWNGSGTLVVHQRDAKSGKLTLLQTIRNGVEFEKGLKGVMHVALSPAGEHLYTAAGRFGGDDAVCAFSVEKESGRLNFIQCLTGNELPADFGGGNEIVASPDGLQLAVACTLSDCLARFSRDPETGKLRAIDGFACGPPAKPGACGVAYDPTGRFLHVADENSESVVVFRNLTR